jgi:hypothetical protein
MGAAVWRDDTVRQLLLCLCSAACALAPSAGKESATHPFMCTTSPPTPAPPAPRPPPRWLGGNLLRSGTLPSAMTRLTALKKL